MSRLSVFGPTKGQTVSDLRADLSDLCDEVQDFLDRIKAENRDLTSSESQQFESWMSDIQAVKKDLRRAEDLRDRQLRAAEAQSILQEPIFNQLNGGVRASVFPGTENMSTPRIQHIVPRLSAFKNTPEGQRDAYVAGNWLKAILSRSKGGIDEQAEQILSQAGFDIRMTGTESAPGSGGYLVPSPMSNSIIDVRAQAGVIRRVARIVPMSSDSFSEPKLLSGPTVTYPGEAGEFTESDETWGSVALTAKKRGILCKISAELRDDALINVVDQLASKMGHEFALKEDAEGISGDSTSTYGGETGLLAAIGSAGVSTAATGHDTWGELDMADFTAVMGKLPSKYVSGASWICSSNFYFGAMLRALAAAGGNTMISLAQGVDMGLFLGKPVYFTDYMPTATATATVCALFGNFSESMMLGDRQGVEIAISDQRYFEFDLIGIRGKTRYDINVHEGGDASNPGAYVALKTAS